MSGSSLYSHTFLAVIDSMSSFSSSAREYCPPSLPGLLVPVVEQQHVPARDQRGVVRVIEAVGRIGELELPAGPAQARHLIDPKSGSSRATWSRFRSDTSTEPSGPMSRESAWLQSCTAPVSVATLPTAGLPGSVRFESGSVLSAGEMKSNMSQTIPFAAGSGVPDADGVALLRPGRVPVPGPQHAPGQVHHAPVVHQVDLVVDGPERAALVDQPGLLYAQRVDLGRSPSPSCRPCAPRCTGCCRRGAAP